MSENKTQRINQIKIKIANELSPTFCLAKWHHVTLYLQTGETHSCYHPRPHKIPLELLAENPSVLHNTPHKKQERLEMLTGQKPSGCQYCWNIESLGEDYISDRHIKTASLYRPHRIQEIKQYNWDSNINPEYIEINFGNECNFKCGYCHPKYSTRFYNEIQKHGPVTTVKNHRCDIDWMQLYQREQENPYVDAWWRWWPEVKKTLEILRITGGEPTLHESTWRLFEELQSEPLPHLELNMNSNLGVKTALIEKLSSHVNTLTESRKIKTFRLFTSIDTWGKRAEYIRTGLDLDLWQKNLHTFLNSTPFAVTFMITFNVLSVSSFRELLEQILVLRKQYGWDSTGEHRIRFDTPYLREPLQYDINLLPKEEYLPIMQQHLDFIAENCDDSRSDKFTSIEYEKFRRVVDYMKSTNLDEAKLNQGRADFYNWFNELDVRRETNFLQTFPEMTDFYNMCKGVANNV